MSARRLLCDDGRKCFFEDSEAKHVVVWPNDIYTAVCDRCKPLHEGAEIITSDEALDRVSVWEIHEV